MILKMSKVEIVGPKDVLLSVLAVIHESGALHIDPDIREGIEKGQEKPVKTLLYDEKVVSERIFLENMQKKIEELFSLVPGIAVRESYIEPHSILGAAAELIDKHIAFVRVLREKAAAWDKEKSEFSRYSVFLAAIEPLARSVKGIAELDFIGIAIKDVEGVERLKRLISDLTDGRFELLTAVAEDGGLVGLITTGKALSEKVKKTLSDERVPELSLPAAFDTLDFSQKTAYLKNRISELSAEIDKNNGEIENFSKRWMPMYRSVREWLNERLKLIGAAAFAYQTKMCFFITGWMPAEAVGGLGRRLTEKFGGSVILEEKRILEQEMGRVPVVLRNPPYFRPFEMFSRILPLPAYTSYDPTPFIGIFFPLFFGIMLGDAGYGLVLLMTAAIIIKKLKGRKFFCDAAKILLASSLYAIIFGGVYGEFFGAEITGLGKLKLIDRRSAVMPMLYFAVSVGVFHVALGLFFGFFSALRRNLKKEAAVKFLNIFIIACMMLLLASFFLPFPAETTKPVIIAAVALTALLTITGGLISPLEMLKNIGNIISYARIMAIGLTSVFLAHTANSFAGTAGSAAAGVAAAVMLHIINLILGVFSPTIHSLRLHYVEFFSKFLEHGGRKFEPLKK